MVNVCDSWYVTECEESSCCESYRFRLILAGISALSVLAAVLVGVVWLFLEFRPAYRSSWNTASNRLRRDDSEAHKIEEKSFEETKYLRRYSELNPLAARRHSIDN